MKTVHWLAALLVLNALWATDLFVLGHGFDGGLLLGLGRLAGLYGALALVVQLVLIARLPWVEVRLGMDRLTAWHRWSGFWVLWLLVAHVVFITLGYARQDGQPLLSEVGTLVFDTDDVLIAAIALVLLVVVGVTSARLARRRMRYETWHLVHVLAYLAIILGFLHQVTLGHDFVTTAAGRAYWWALYGVALGAVVVTRIGVPVLRNLRHRLRVVSVVRESANVVTIWIGGRDLAKLRARAGQFFLWRFGTRWWEAHPYSLSAMPDGRHLRITVKALGDGSAWLQRIRPGTPVFAEGPYGAFTAEKRTRRHVLLVAGGVGVTPIRALLEEFAVAGDDIVVIYRARQPVLAHEMDAIARWCGASLHVVTDPLDAYGMISHLVHDVRHRDVYVCGPPGLTDAVRRALHELGVPDSQCHFERFAFAS
ncbi:MAG TPA: ferredoxin reductase family protein [Amycolatopsis sp.]|nr:ferredoxin reductase family protein [Amycolatopsis sp.]